MYVKGKYPNETVSLGVDEKVSIKDYIVGANTSKDKILLFKGEAERLLKILDRYDTLSAKSAPDPAQPPALASDPVQVPAQAKIPNRKEVEKLSKEEEVAGLRVFKDNPHYVERNSVDKIKGIKVDKAYYAYTILNENPVLFSCNGSDFLSERISLEKKGPLPTPSDKVALTTEDANVLIALLDAMPRYANESEILAAKLADGVHNVKIGSTYMRIKISGSQLVERKELCWSLAKKDFID